MMTKKMLAFHFDLKRPMWRRDYMDRLVARLAAWGFNTILYELEDKLRFARHPSIAHPEAWSREQTRDFVQACRQQGVEVIPMFQSLGHAEAVVGKPEYAHLREDPAVLDQYDPLSADARALILELFDEIIETFQPHGFFHIGGDETWSLGQSAKCRPIVKKIGIGGLYLAHMQPIFAHLHARGLRPMIWADIILQHPGILDQIPQYVVLVDWNYSRCTERTDRVLLWGTGQYTWPEFQALPDSPAKQLATRFAVDDQTARAGTFRTFYHTDALRAHGFDVITASACRSAGDSLAMPRARHLENVFHSARQGTTAGCGEIVTCWTVRYNHPELTLPAAVAATASVLDRAAILGEFTRQTFGVALPELDEAWQLLSPTVPFSETMALWPATKLLARGQDPLAQYLEDLRRQDRPALQRAQHERSSLPADLASDPTASDAWVRAAETLTAARRDGYMQGRAVVETLRGRARRNADGFDYWVEAADALVFYADFALALLRGTLRQETPALLERIAVLRERTRALWERTYTTGSVADELIVRYGFHEACLRGTGAGNLTPLTFCAPGIV